MNRIIALVLYYLSSIKRNRSRLLDIFIWPTLELLMFGFLSVYLERQTSALSKISFVILGGLIFWHFFSRMMSEVVLQLTDDILSRNLSNILVTPVTSIEIALAMMIASFLKLWLSMSVVFVAGWVLYQLNIFTLGLPIIGYIGILVLWGVSLGLTVSSLYFLVGPRAGPVTWALAGIIQPFCLVFYPRSVLPLPIKIVSYFVPPSYVFEQIRQQLLGNRVNWPDLELAAILTGLYVLLALVIFQMSFKQMSKSGIIAKL